MLRGRRKFIFIPAALVALGAAAWLAIGFFGVHTLLFDREVNEAGPVFASGATAATMGGSASGGATSSANTVSELASGSFVDLSHPGEGRAVVLNDGTEQRFLRFEDFRTDNGPDLNVYLSTGSAEGPSGELDDDFIDLGDLKGNVGPQNYEIPEGVDLDRYDTVVIWCVRFGVAFTAADLEPMPN